MFSDTHFHLHHLDELGIDCKNLFTEFAKRNYSFLLDIGTHCDDLIDRMSLVDTLISKLDNSEYQNKIKSILYFSAGIWPDVSAIKDRENQLCDLEHMIVSQKDTEKVIAIGECGLDHHWNVSGVDHRNEDDFTNDIFSGEAELFEAQLEMGKKFDKPIIVHSREAFEGTLSCIKNVDYNVGIIHCFSYGKEEAKQFLDLGWYIALGGALTYTKKSKLQDMRDLVKYIPKDRLVLETDSPYLAPVPFRGTTNTPLLIEYTYQFVADILCMSVESLCKIFLENTKTLFRLK